MGEGRGLEQVGVVMKSKDGRAKAKGAEKAARDLQQIEKASIPIEQRIGTVIRSRRQALGLTLAEVSDGSDVSRAMISRIENGQVAPSLDVLERISNALGQGLSTMFMELERKEGTAQLIKAEDQMEVVRTGTRHGHTYRLLSYQRGPRHFFEPFLIGMDKESESYPRFQHEGTEFIYMLSGSMEYKFGNTTYVVEPGDALTFSGEVEHGPATLLDESVKFLSIIIYNEE